MNRGNDGAQRSRANKVVGDEGERRSEVKEEAASRRRGTFAEPLTLGANDRSNARNNKTNHR